MDLLCSPESPSREVGRTPYFGDPIDRWDGGPFLTYPQRGGFPSMVPLSLRQYDLETPYTELLHPSELQLRQKILTKWLFFGLILEFVGANQQENPDRPPDHPAAVQLRTDIYQDCVKTNEIGEKFLSGEIIKNIVPGIVGVINASNDIQARLDYLSSCLRTASWMLASPATQGVDRSLKFAIAGVGEFMSVIIRNGVPLKYFGDVSLPQTGFDWKHDFITRDDIVRERMLSARWCPSDLARANALYQHLFTMHYVSLMDRHVPGRDHAKCTEVICCAAQINNDTYQLSHSTEGCSCEEFRVDIGKIKEVLGGTESYPILAFDPEDEMGLLVEMFKPGDEYIALSHVWADGLGNTQDNTLQRCQIGKLRQLVSAVEEAVWATDKSKPRPKYYIWIDTLCCPVFKLEPEHNKLSLLRMKTVYEKATHVLVLDLALSIHDAENLRPATLLLRIFGTSIWMRRLWTLQEGVLAKSLYFQFRDKPIHAQSLLPLLESPSDYRYWVLWADLNKELHRLTHLNPSTPSPLPPQPHPLYRQIQSALDFRSVSYPSDEPICIATLLSLPLAPILLSSSCPSTDPPETTSSARMRTLWRLLAAADGGIPARLIFSVDTPLSEPGYGWAPKTMLGNADVRGKQRYALEYTVVDAESGMGRPGHTPSGQITEFGLGVDFPGWVLRPKPIAEGVPVGVWEGVLKEWREDFVFFRDAGTGEWFRMADWHAVAGPPTAVTRGLICGEVDGRRVVGSAVEVGRMAVVRGEDVDGYNAMLWLLVEVLDEGAVPREGDGKEGYRVRWVRKVMVTRVSGLDLLVLEMCRGIAVEVAASEETREFVRIKGVVGIDGENKEFAEAKEKVRQKLKDVTADAWKNIPGFAAAVEKTVSAGMEEYIWALIPMRLSCDVEGVATPLDQRWYVD
ncbi:hypothetical protein QBC34DRAFT_349181 [Podospora aff. communis PSN243]|uniref:Heterokaryon incompatibility domain-containing protein n=1 Tax=Podospora aff. communis PSN243 TaxID=3040156 RepID=A0AAV9GR71_9PEZI|nr:hypothetical protein QBC34DRAFT_349181 [Podospora aff. communis PSN243]